MYLRSTLNVVRNARRIRPYHHPLRDPASPLDEIGWRGGLRIKVGRRRYESERHLWTDRLLDLTCFAERLHSDAFRMAPPSPRSTLLP